MILGSGGAALVPRVYSGLGAEPPKSSLLDEFLGVRPDYLQRKLDSLELLLFLSVGASLSSAIATAIMLRRR